VRELRFSQEGTPNQYIKMIRSIFLTLSVAILFASSVLGDVKALAGEDDTTRGGGGGGGGGHGGGGGGGPYSQQYHYSSYPGGDVGGGTYSGISVDLSTGLFLALGAIIVLLALAAVVYPLLSKGGGGGGWEAPASTGWRSLNKNYNLAGTAEKVLSAVEKMYDTYQKTH